MTKPMIYTGTTISFHHKGKFHQANKSHASFSRVVELCKKGNFDEAVKLIDLKTVVSAALAGTRASIQGNTVVYQGKPINSTLATRILTLAKEGFSVAPLLLFLDNLMQNTSHRAINELYGFLEVAKLPITDDGHFLAYKSVRQDFTDHHTGKMDNSVGKVVSMDRNQVDEDKDRTCSRGLHFAAHEYASGFGSGGRMVVVKVNPKDVVAIPSDYNNQKGRACSYLILEEVQRSDSSLVGKDFVPSVPKVAAVVPPKVTDGSRVKLSPQGLRKYSSRPNQGSGGAGMASLRSSYGFLFKVQWDNGDSNSYEEGDLEVCTSPKPKRTDVWKDERNTKVFTGTLFDFPEGGDSYTLSRKSDGKLYSGDFFLVRYDPAFLVFKRHATDTKVERYVTIKDVSDWDIRRIFD